MHILLIDDEPLLIQETLRVFGYACDIARDGQQGLQKLQENPTYYDLVILDLKMPVKNGWETLDQIRSNPSLSSIYVIILTANNLEEALIKGLQTGADEYIAKPVSPKRLHAHLQAFERRLNMGIKPKVQETYTLTTPDVLTVREQEIMRLVAQGLSNKQIAEKLIISETTVKNHLVNIFEKLNVANRTQAILKLQNVLL